MDPGLRGEAFLHRRDIVINDYQNHRRRKKGYHEDNNVELKTFLTTPVFVNVVIVPVTGMANNEEPYNDNDVKQPKLLMSPIWEILEHNKSKQVLLKSCSALEQSSNSVMITDQKVIIEYVNPRFEATTGWERS